MIGVAERSGSALFNTAVAIGPDGVLGTFRKVHLWGDENLIFEPGDLGFPVFHTPIGRIAMFVCYDGWFPESYRTCVLAGADLICIPTNWVPIPGQDPNREAMATVLCMASAHTNSVVVVAADRIGAERGQPFIGQSVIVNHTGWPLAGPRPAIARRSSTPMWISPRLAAIELGTRSTIRSGTDAPRPTSCRPAVDAAGERRRASPAYGAWISARAPSRIRATT